MHVGRTSGSSGSQKTVTPFSTPSGIQGIQQGSAIGTTIPSMPCRALALTMTQDKLSMTKGPGKTVRIGCKSDGSPSYIHWYRQKGSGDLERILYVQTSTGAESYDIGDSERFKADDKGLILRIDRAVNGDTATYYCAAWDSHSDANHGDPLTKTSARLNKAAAKPNGLVRLITNTPGSMNAALLKRMAALEVSGILWCPVNSG
ncbi:TVC1 protein, partial [Polypterus senegalus]